MVFAKTAAKLRKKSLFPNIIFLPEFCGDLKKAIVSVHEVNQVEIHCAGLGVFVFFGEDHKPTLFIKQVVQVGIAAIKRLYFSVGLNLSESEFT